MTDTPRKCAADFDPEVLGLFDAYVHGAIDRRAFLAKAARFAVGGTTAVGLLAALSPQFAAAQQVRADDPRLHAQYVTYPSPSGYGQGRGYWVTPAQTTAPLPAVLVIHENRGLNPHIEDVARRLALAGYRAFAPDALFPLGGYPGDEDAARTLFAQLDQAKTRQDFLAAANFLLAAPGGNARLGVVGFCYGGAMASFLATRLPQLRAAVPFYGSAPALEDVAQIQAELLVVLAANDERVNAQWPGYQAALERAQVRYALYQPADTQHGFNNDTTPRYDQAAAAQAWQQMLALFERTLKA